MTEYPSWGLFHTMSSGARTGMKEKSIPLHSGGYSLFVAVEVFDAGLLPR